MAVSYMNFAHIGTNIFNNYKRAEDSCSAVKVSRRSRAPTVKAKNGKDMFNNFNSESIDRIFSKDMLLF